MNPRDYQIQPEDEDGYRYDHEEESHPEPRVEEGSKTDYHRKNVTPRLPGGFKDISGR